MNPVLPRWIRLLDKRRTNSVNIPENTMKPDGQKEENHQKKLGVFPFVIGGMSFIPLIGVGLGVIAIIWGLVTRKAGGKTLAIVGACGILFTIVLYSALFYFGAVKRDGVYDELRLKLSESLLTSLVSSIEFYKLQHGQYPESLEALQKSLPKNSTVSVFDPTDVKIGGKPRYYYYERIDADHYYLLGVGRDGQPFTDDDLVPTIEITPHSKVGLVIKNRVETGGHMTPLERVTERVNRLGDPNDPETPRALLTLDEFFEGNTDAGSIGCNLPNPPEPKTFYTLFKSISQRPDVKDIRVQISDMNDMEWPFSDTVYIMTSASPEEVFTWFPEDLRPDETFSGFGVAQSHEPYQVPSGVQPVGCWWD